jgi:hypothetical protein
LAEQRHRFGAPRLHVLLRREGHQINHKRTERLYREEGLSLRLKKRKKRQSHLRVLLDQPERRNQHWSMDFVSDNLYNGRRFRVLTVVDNFTRECPVMVADHSLTGQRVTRVSFTYKDRDDGNKTKTMTIAVTEFIRRFLLHVLPHRFMKIRYYGFLSNICKGKTVLLIRRLIGKSLKILLHAGETIQQKMLRLTGRDILRCPSCLQGMMVRLTLLYPLNSS